MNVLMTASGISKTYIMGDVKVPALQDVSFELLEGEFVIVLGPSGSGKSTLLNIIGGMDKTTDGEIYYRELALHEASPKALTAYRRKSVGFVFQFYNLMPNLTALENVQLASEIADDPLPAKDVLAMVGLSDRLDHFPSQLSGGEQQRVALARALAKNPDLILCDEPTGALDITAGRQVLLLLTRFCRDYHKTVVVITHNVVVSAIADRVFHVSGGKLASIEVNEVPTNPELITW